MMNQKSMRKSFAMLSTLALFGALFTFASGEAAAADMMKKHQSLECASCHDAKGFKAPEPQKCLSCHTSDQIVKATERFNFTAKLTDPKTKKEIAHKALVNPHDSYHFGRTENCFDCHREHAKSTNACATCHDIEPWKMGAPR